MNAGEGGPESASERATARAAPSQGATLGSPDRRHPDSNRHLEEHVWRPTTIRNYDVSIDGKRFIGVIASGATDSGASPTPQIQAVLNSFEEVRRRVPAK